MRLPRLLPLAAALALFLPSDGRACTDIVTAAPSTASPAAVDVPPPPLAGIGSERLYIGTGEYNPTPGWHGILRFENAQLLDGVVTPNGTVPVKSVVDGNGVRLNFVHTTYVNEARNEMYVGALFTTADNHDCSGPQEVCGSIAVLANARTLSGPQAPARHIFGSSTQINQPHGIWVDRQRNMLYAANTFSGNILVWNGASTVDGNTAPSRVIRYTEMGWPVHLYVDAAADRMFVVTMPGPGASEPSVLVFNQASTLNGNVVPRVRIMGPASRLGSGNNRTTHNVWYASARKLLFVAHHTNEVLIYDLASVDLAPPAPVTIDVAPRVLQINEQAGVDEYHWSAYGLFYVGAFDRLYVAAGYTPGGDATHSGPPQPGSPRQAVKVYDDISDPSASGLVPPDRTIFWSNGQTYFPAQPLWVSLSTPAAPGQ